MLNNFNNPFLIQLPTINAVYNQKCSWLPVTSIMYFGMLMSYLRRFDSSRNTSVYVITVTVLFMVGSALWMVISVLSIHSWPLGIVTGPTVLVAVSLFAYKRMEIRTLWEGKFFDPEYADKESLKQISATIEMEGRESDLSFR